MSKSQLRAAIAAYIALDPSRVIKCPTRVAQGGGSLQIKNPPAKG